MGKKKKRTRKSAEFSGDEEELLSKKSLSKERVRDRSEEDSEVERTVRRKESRSQSRKVEREMREELEKEEEEKRGRRRSGSSEERTVAPGKGGSIQVLTLKA